MRFYSQKQIEDMKTRYSELSRISDDRMRLSERLEKSYLELKLGSEKIK